jgi:hypothetical protein
MPQAASPSPTTVLVVEDEMVLRMRAVDMIAAKTLSQQTLCIRITRVPGPDVFFRSMARTKPLSR